LEITLTNRGKRTVELGPAQVTSAQLKVGLDTSVLAPGESAVLSVTAEAQEPGRLSGYVIIPTDHPGVAQIRLPVFGKIGE